MARPDHAVSNAQTARRPWGRNSLAAGTCWLMAAVILGVSVSGCTPLGTYLHNGFKVGPNYHQPVAPVADNYIDAADQRVRNESDDLSHWWRVFNDPILNSLVCFAYHQNLTLKEAGFRVLQSRAELGIATGSLLPQSQSANGGFIQTGVSHEVANSLVATPQRFFGTWGFGVGAGWEIDFWGRLRRGIEAADGHFNASVENYDDVLVTLLGDLAANYVQFRVLQRQYELVLVNIQLQRQALSAALERFTTRQTSELDVTQAQTILSQTEALIPELEINIRKASNRLCVLLGIPPDGLMGKLRQAPVPCAPVDIAVGLPAQLLARRPDVRRAEREAAAQCALIGAAEGDLYPQVSILGNVGYSAQQFASLFNNTAFRGSIGPTFDWKILNYGRIVNNVALQDARFQERVAAYQQTVLKASEEVENGIVTFLKAQQKVVALEESVRAALRGVQLALEQYRAGKVDFIRVAVLEQNLVEQQDREVEARGQIALGLIQTYKALGGGWQIRLQGCNNETCALAGASPGLVRAPTPSPFPPAPVQGERPVIVPVPLAVPTPTMPTPKPLGTLFPRIEPGEPLPTSAPSGTAVPAPAKSPVTQSASASPLTPLDLEGFGKKGVADPRRPTESTFPPVNQVSKATPVAPTPPRPQVGQMLPPPDKTAPKAAGQATTPVSTPPGERLLPIIAPDDVPVKKESHLPRSPFRTDSPKEG